MTRPLTLAALLATALVTSGCDLDTLRGEKSAAQKWHEHQNPVAVEDDVPPVAVATLVSVAAVEVAEPLPVVVPVVEEPCYPIFRVRTCEEVTP